MKVTLVKKIKADGAPCRKCAEVAARLERDGVADRIDAVVVADERDPEGHGMRLAAQLGVDRAPFFVVEREGAAPEVHTVYLRLLREVLGRDPGAPGSGAAAAEATELVETGGIDFL